MFAPMSPMGERVRVQNELRELERNAAARSARTPRRTIWRAPLALAGRVMAAAVAVAGIGRTITTTTTTQVCQPAQDC